REVPPETVEAAILAAAAAGVPVLLNPAPAGKISRRLLGKVHILIANLGEAEFLLGGSVRGSAGALRGVSRLGSLLAKGGIAIMTLGRRGGCLHAPQSSAAIRVPAHRVRTVDTTGAGDAFVGAFAADWLESRDPLRAARFAAAAAALSVTRPGAIPSLPRIPEVHALLRMDGGRTGPRDPW
ncbi:MAG TPA: PfkB family carbohydrate kinase, partial [Planctomycetota bacterium]|nr:PfkB family carbohydrate kinase [Planctomycetota bacterium]